MIARLPSPCATTTGSASPGALHGCSPATKLLSRKNLKITEHLILPLLAGHDSKNPVALDDLAAKAGLLPETVEMVLDQLFQQHPAPVNRAQVTRCNKTHMVYWPTGIVPSSIPFGRQTINPARRPVFDPRPPTRVFIAAPAAEIVVPVVQKAINEMEEHQVHKAAAETKPATKTSRIIAHLFAHGETSGKDLAGATETHCGVEAFIKPYINRGMIIRHGKQRRGKSYSIAEGYTPQDFQAISTLRKQRGEKPKPATREVALPVHSGIVMPAAEPELKVTQSQNIHDQHAAELKAALDKIHEQKSEIARLNAEINHLGNMLSSVTPSLDEKGNFIHPDSPARARFTAPDILIAAADAIGDRAAERDKPDGERSMATAVATYNALTGHQISERNGWLFMSILKLARAQGGKHRLDDYIDGAAYIALAGECAEAL